MESVTTIDHPTLSPSRLMSQRDIRVINLLSRVASDITSPVGKARISACIVHQNELVSFGINELKSHPLQAKFGKNEDAIYLHAEVSAIKNALKIVSQEEMNNCKLYVCRVKFFDNTKNRLVFGLAKPCDGCVRCISTFGIRNVIYTLNDGGYEKL